jgi:hypothetical protein
VHVQDITSAQAGKPHALTAADTQQRFSDYVLDGPHHRLIAVCEDHSTEGQEATNTLAAIGGCMRMPAYRLGAQHKGTSRCAGSSRNTRISVMHHF